MILQEVTRMVEINKIWYDVNNIRKMKFENEHIYVYFYKDEEPLNLIGNQDQFNYLVAKVSGQKNN